MRSVKCLPSSRHGTIIMTGISIIYPMLLFTVICIPAAVQGVPLSEFIDFGESAGDAVEEGYDDHKWVLSGLEVPFLIANETYSRLVISNDGQLVFSQTKSTEVGSLNYFSCCPSTSKWTNVPTSLQGDPFIAAFWGDVDTRGTGAVYTRYSTNDASANSKVKNIVKTYFDEDLIFVPTAVVIVTWDHVGYWNRRSYPVNTFQCIVATNGTTTYAIFLYLDDGINWPVSTDTGLAAGLVIGGDHFTIKESLTTDVIEVDELSNVGVPGVFIFQISDDLITAPPNPVCRTCKDRISFSACSFILKGHNNDKSTIPVSCQQMMKL